MWNDAECPSDAAPTCPEMALAKILVIEDDDETAAEILAALIERGYAPERASSGHAGLDKGRLSGWDVLIVDRMLPERDGLSVIATLRSEGVKTPALVLSALGSVDDRI